MVFEVRKRDVLHDHAAFIHLHRTAGACIVGADRDDELEVVLRRCPLIVDRVRILSAQLLTIDNLAAREAQSSGSFPTQAIQQEGLQTLASLRGHLVQGKRHSRMVVAIIGVAARKGWRVIAARWLGEPGNQDECQCSWNGHSRGSTGSLSRASTPNTHSCTSRSG